MTGGLLAPGRWIGGPLSAGIQPMCFADPDFDDFLEGSPESLATLNATVR